jgi:hypothetical protein
MEHRGRPNSPRPAFFSYTVALDFLRETERPLCLRLPGLCPIREARVAGTLGAAPHPRVAAKHHRASSSISSSGQREQQLAGGADRARQEDGGLIDQSDKAENLLRLNDATRVN